MSPEKTQPPLPPELLPNGMPLNLYATLEVSRAVLSWAQSQLGKAIIQAGDGETKTRLLRLHNRLVDLYTEVKDEQFSGSYPRQDEIQSGKTFQGCRHFDTQVYVVPPDNQARVVISQHHPGLSTETWYVEVEDLDMVTREWHHRAGSSGGAGAMRSEAQALEAAKGVWKRLVAGEAFP